MANLKLTDVEKTYAGAVNVLNHIDLDIQTGELVVFVGPSGWKRSPAARSRSTARWSMTCRRASAALPWCSSPMRFIRI